jgi:LysR family transcriptional activator of nhaA
MSWFASPELYHAGNQGFPESLKKLPVLLPTSQSAVRARLDHWFVQHEITPRIVGEFEDSALLMTFGASGMGVFPAPDLLAEELTGQYDVQRIGRCDKVEEYFFAIGTERKVMHPLVRKILPANA